MGDIYKIDVPGPQPHPKFAERADFAMTMPKLVAHVVDGDRRFTASARGIRAGLRILGALDSEPFVLDSEDKGLLKDVLSEPTCGFPTVGTVDGGQVFPYGAALLPFIEAVENASKYKPGDAPEESGNDG